MFGILSETMITASRMDGFRYPSGKDARPYRAAPREPDTPKRTQRPDIRDAAADQPL